MSLRDDTEIEMETTLEFMWLGEDISSLIIEDIKITRNDIIKAKMLAMGLRELISIKKTTRDIINEYNNDWVLNYKEYALLLEHCTRIYWDYIYINEMVNITDEIRNEESAVLSDNLTSNVK